MTDNTFTTNVGETAYLDWKQYPTFSYKCITYLMENNELVWKLLKHTEADAWSNTVPNLTPDEKRALIYTGQEDASLFNLFLDIKQPDVFTKEVSIIRICPYYAAGTGRTTGYLEMSMEVFCHQKINHLSNYQTRMETIVGELLNVFHGANIGGIGFMTFNKLADQTSRLYNSGQIPFGGKQIIFTNKVA